MTTIATDGHTMAGDSYCGGDCFHTEIRKVFRAKDGAILGSAGQAFDYTGFLAWYEDGGELNVTDGFEGLILKPDGRVFCVDSKGRQFEHQVPAAVGSGAAVAYGAMDAGASPAKAIAIASKRNAFTGGSITVEALPPMRKGS